MSATQVTRAEIALLHKLAVAYTEESVSVTIYDDGGSGHHSDEMDGLVRRLVADELARLSPDEIRRAVLPDEECHVL